MKPKVPFSPQQSGVTLIELMVSIVIGMIIMVAVISAYIGASGASRMAEATGRMNEDAQMALSILSQQLRMAGVNPSQPNRSSVTTATANLRGNSVPLHNTVTNAYSIRGCDVKFSDVTTATTTSALTCGHSSSSFGTAPSSVAIAYEADRYNTIPTSSGAPTDCVGSSAGTMTFNFNNSQGVASSTTVAEVENRFYIGTSTHVVNPTLYCKGNGNTIPQPMVENIEDIQIKYGTIDPTEPVIYKSATTVTVTAAQVRGYLTANEVDTDATKLTGAAGSASRWNAVKTVRVCVLARSESQLFETATAATYLNCAGTTVTPTDRRLRRAYTTTVILRNQ